jgi:uncharacterized protein with PQ loop repeat
LKLSKHARIFVIVGAIGVTVSTFPQVYQTVTTGLTRDINLKMLIAAVIGIGAYAYYALITGQRIFALADGFDCAMWSIVLAMKINNIMNGTDGI